jgi:hypothetical protein
MIINRIGYALLPIILLLSNYNKSSKEEPVKGSLVNREKKKTVSLIFFLHHRPLLSSKLSMVMTQCLTKGLS